GGDPSGPETPVVLVHPINTDGSVWTEVAGLLGLPSVALDLRGHGRSGLAGPFTVDGYVDDVLAAMDAVGVAAAHLAGGSVGGTIGVALAARHPERVHTVTTFGSTLGTGATEADIQAMVDELDAKGTARYFAELAPLVVGAAYREDERVLAGLRAA